MTGKQQQKKLGNVYLTWFTTVTFGEFIAFTIPSLVGVLSVSLNLPQLIQTVLVILAGMGEGVVLGYFQSKVLKQCLPSLKQLDWVKATVTGATLAWIIGMIPSTLYDSLHMLSWNVLIPAGIVLACCLLVSLPYFQYRVLRTYAKNALLWIWLNILAWLCGLGVLLACMWIAPEGVLSTLLFSILGGLGMASTMAAITGMYLVRIKKI